MKPRMNTQAPRLQEMYWPAVSPFDPTEREDLLTEGLVADLPAIHRKLATINPYYFGYRDSPFFQNADSAHEARLVATRLKLDDLMLGSAPLASAWAEVKCTDQTKLCDELSHLVESNPAVNHSFFDYCATQADRRMLQRVAWNEICRNEVVDDEVSLMFTGLTGSAKAALALNFADEMGHGTLKNQHTYWLRQHLDANDEMESFSAYRGDRSWYLQIPSNVFNSLLLRPGYHWAAYGHFTVTETWVAPHFVKLIQGFERVSYDRELTYFTAHEKLDRLHGAELLEALKHQTPELTPREVQLIEWGARLAIAAGIQYYDHFLAEIMAM